MWVGGGFDYLFGVSDVWVNLMSFHGGKVCQDEVYVVYARERCECQAVGSS